MRFKLDPYDITQPLIIDPTLQWATYYGGTDFDYSYGCATDLSGNVYIAGQTASTTFIASGGHQNTIGGDNDAYLVKFNPNGVRLWATYYGGTNLESASGCATDAAGNVFLAGYTGSTTGIFTNGHQAALSGGYDGFLVKFNGNGLRIWATYYGGPELEYGNDCTTDNAGNVYFTGRTLSSSNISSGGHQNTIGGSADGFLVKFNSNGVRQWGTYYGGTGIDDGQSCTTDNAGNVYLSGQTYSSSNIAFNGHQMNYVSLSDGYLVKFNSNGVRQWSTYYGGSGADEGRGCATDTSGNIYLAGRTTSLSGIASNGYQNTLAGGVEAFLSKFNTNGVRQWATYYGGEGTDNLRRCTTDQAGNIYLTGETQSVNGIASSGYQNTHNEGNYDAYLVKINSAGVRQWGTYYGGTGGDYGFNCAVDATGNVFLCGHTTSLTGIASGGLQNTHSGGTYDAFLVKLSSESTPVPLTLTRFSATAVKNKTLLNWHLLRKKM
ncbi:MAG: hypothetical protein EOP54_00540 [Sphingobacteriales bacterium]|nr:MAG: hypothetical protein EOP54_00540 [Sphingobacteriales bacterium]